MDTCVPPPAPPGHSPHTVQRARNPLGPRVQLMQANQTLVAQVSPMLSYLTYARLRKSGF